MSFSEVIMRRSFGTIVDRGNGKYQIKWVSPNGKRCSITVRGTLEHAERELALRYGTETSKRTITWGEYWRLFVEPTLDGLAESTKHNYRREWKHDLAPRISATRISDTSHRYVQNVIDSIPTRPLQEHALALFRKICNMAIRDGMLESNPCSAVKMKPKQRKQKHLWTPAQALDALEAVRGCKFEPLVLLELGGGLRHEEASAMHWEDVAPYKDLCAVRIKRALTAVSGRKVLKETKTESSDRIMIIGEPFSSRLLELKEERGEYAHGPIMATPVGYREPGSSSRMWCYYARQNGIDYVPFGHMRSNFATLHGEAFSPDSLVSLAMGHTDGTTRGKHYQQATIDGLERIARNLADHFEHCKDAGPEQVFGASSIFGD